MRGRLKNIVEYFDYVLARECCGNIDWDLVLSDTQGVGFFPKNNETRIAMSKLDYGKGGEYDCLMDGLLGVVNCMSSDYETRSVEMSRGEVYASLFKRERFDATKQIEYHARRQLPGNAGSHFEFDDYLVRWIKEKRTLGCTPEQAREHLKRWTSDPNNNFFE